MKKQLGVGIVGVGVLGTFHAQTLANRIPAARVVAIADSRIEIARALAEELDVQNVYASAAELAADADVEAMVVVSSDAAHVDGILAAAAAGKDVFCEKPITETLADADRALAAVEQAGVQLQIGFMRRFDPAYIAAKNAIESGQIGTPVFLKNAHRGKEPIRSGRAASDGCDPHAFIGSNIHDYDNARWLLDDEAVAVTAVGSRVVAETNPDGIDSAVSIVEFQCGGLADIEYISATMYGYDVRTEVVGDRGTIFIGSPDGVGCLIATDRGLEKPAVDHWITRFGETYRIELEAWVEQTLQGNPATVTGEDGRAALAIANAAQESMESHRRVVL